MKFLFLKFLLISKTILDLNLFFKKIASCICEIKIKIKEAGNQTIIYDKFGSPFVTKFPDVYLGETKIENATSIINLVEEENIIILRWNKSFQSCSSMFRNCKNITEVDLSSFKNSIAFTLDQMFYGCESLISINFGNFNTSLIESMALMFYGCLNLISLNLSSFVTTNVIYMDRMFYNCKSLKEINISNFNLSRIRLINSMFYGCESLISINLPTIQKHRNIDLDDMFRNCFNITEIDLSNFSFVINRTDYMFYNCYSLTSLNFPNFNLIDLKSFLFMFSNCLNLKYINLNNASDNSSLNYNSIFDGIGDGLIVCINESKSPKLYSEIIKLNSIVINCSYKPCKYYHYYDKENYYCTEEKKCPNNYNKIIEEKKECIDDCSKDNKYKYEFKKKCYTNCTIGPFNLINKGYLCEIKCPKDLPFELVKSQECISNCNINAFLLKLCIIKYEGIEELNIIDLFLNNILRGLESNDLDINILKNNMNITLEYKWISFLLTKIKRDEVTNIINEDLYQCLNKLRIIYNISNENYLYTLNIQINNSDNKKFIYEIYYYSNEENILKRMNLIVCENNGEMFKQSKCKNYSVQSIINDLCISCDNSNGYYELYNETNNILKRCYKNIQGYYLDQENQVFKRCYNSCLTCEKEGNEFEHNCKECTNENPYKSGSNCYTKQEDNKFIDCTKNEIDKYEFKKKCYEKCPEGTKISKKIEFLCEVKCTKELPFELISTQECIQNCSLYDKFQGLCKLNYMDNIEQMKFQDNQLNNIRDIITKEFNISNIDNGNDFSFKENDILYSFTTTNNQNNEGKINNTVINLGDCELKLKNKYNIPEEKSLYILKIEISIAGMKIPKFEYEVYYPLYDSNLVQLDLSVCSDIKIDVSYPMKIEEDKIDQLDLNSGYYNDICYTTTTEDGTDIVLKDRRDEFLNYNKTICEEECDFKGYNDTMEKATCSCEVKIKIGSFVEIKFDKLKLYRKFTNLNTFSNINVMKCSNFVFNRKIIFKNIGFYLITGIIMLGISSLAVFYFKEYNVFKTTINKLILNKRVKDKTIKAIPEQINEENSIKPKSKKKRKKRRYSVIGNSNLKFKDNIELFPGLKNNDKNSPPIKNDIKKISKYKNSRKRRNSNIIEATNLIQNMLNNNKKLKENDKKLSYNNKDGENDEKSTINMSELSAQEINILPYNKAKKYDKRTFSLYYLSLLRTKHLLIFTFYTKDYNSRIIKIYLFFFTFAINFTINALFFDDLNMHQIYIDEGDFNLAYQLPIIIYSSLITTILNTCIKLLALFQDNILNIKNCKVQKLDEICKEEISKIKIKMILFFIITFSLLFLFWYYLCCFCGVYKNTQVYLLKDTLCSFFTSLITPFGLYLLPGIFRILSLRSKKKRKCLYNFSKLLQLI